MIRRLSFALVLLATAAADVRPGDNTLTEQEKTGRLAAALRRQDDRGLDDPKGKPLPASHVQDGSLNPHPCDYMLVYEKPLGTSCSSLDFKISPGCNSGIFVRTSPLTPRPGKDVGFNGIEIAIDDTTDGRLPRHRRDLRPRQAEVNAMKPVGEWNHIRITCDRDVIEVEVNGRRVSRMDLDEWTEPNKRPDGSAHKFDVAYKDHPRTGYIGLQDHGSDCWYRNIKLRILPATRPRRRPCPLRSRSRGRMSSTAEGERGAAAGRQRGRPRMDEQRRGAHPRHGQDGHPRTGTSTTSACPWRRTAGSARRPSRRTSGKAYRALVRQVVDLLRRAGLLRHARPALVRRRRVGQADRPARDARPEQRGVLEGGRRGLQGPPRRALRPVQRAARRELGRLAQGRQGHREGPEGRARRRPTRPSGCRRLLDAVRATGAKNVVIAGGLDWSYDLSGILDGRQLSDPNGNGVIYANHAYPFKGDTVEKWVAKMEGATAKLPVIVSEFGSDPERRRGAHGRAWVRRVLAGPRRPRVGLDRVGPAPRGRPSPDLGLEIHADAPLRDAGSSRPCSARSLRRHHAARGRRRRGSSRATATSAPCSTPARPRSTRPRRPTPWPAAARTCGRPSDAFQFAWKKASGDLSLAADVAFVGAGKDPHRKACLMIRQDLDADSAYVDVALHGDGLTSLQFREAKGAATHEVQANVSRPARLRIEKRGKYVPMYLAAEGEDLAFSGAADADRVPGAVLRRPRRLRAQQGRDRDGGLLERRADLAAARRGAASRRCTAPWRRRRSPRPTAASSTSPRPGSRRPTGSATARP